MKGFIFDLDGTLLDSIGLWKQIDLDYMKLHGIEYKKEYTDDIKKLTFTECAYYFKDRLGVSKSIEEIQKDWLEMSYEAYENELKLKPYAYEFVKKCKEHGKCIIATSCEYKSAFAALTRLGLMDDFVEIVTTEMVKANKENPAVYHECAKRLSLDIKDCIVFEDVVSAARCANEAGFQVVGVLDEAWLHDWEELQKVSCRTIHSFQELL